MAFVVGTIIVSSSHLDVNSLKARLLTLLFNTIEKGVSDSAWHL